MRLEENDKRFHGKVKLFVLKLTSCIKTNLPAEVIINYYS